MIACSSAVYTDKFKLPMASPPPATPTRAQLEYSLKFKRTDAVATTIKQAIIWGCLVGIARYGYLSIAVLAGKQTFADIVMRVIANVKVSQWIAYLFGVGGVLYGVGERTLRRRTIRRITEDKNNLERKMHPGRTSSNLTESGTTRPGDKL
jgi:hypothetical protein